MKDPGLPDFIDFHGDFRVFRYTKLIRGQFFFVASDLKSQAGRCLQVPEAFCDNNRRGGTVEQEDDIEVEQLVDVAKDNSYKVGP